MSNKKEEGGIKNKLNSEKSKKYKCFVIQPSGVKVLDAAETNFDDVYTLKKSRYTQLKSSDFCIADVTGNNPDVLSEIGVVIGIGGEERIISDRR